MANELLEKLNDLWLARVKLAEEHRKKCFDRVANKLDRYYHTRKLHVFGDYTPDPDELPFPTAYQSHRVSIAKVGEFVRVMLPYVFFKVPSRVVTPRGPFIPEELYPLIYRVAPGTPVSNPNLERGKVQSALGSYLLNYAADDSTYNFRSEARKACQEALVAGRGVVWHELTDTPFGMFPGSFYDTWRNLYLDPDHDDPRLCNYAIRKKRRPTWEVSEDFGIPYEQLKGNATSYAKDTADATDPQYGDGKDVLEFCEVYSRMGIGHRFVTGDPDLRARIEAASARIGENCYLAVARGMEWPLNLPPDQIVNETEDQIAKRLEWPIAFHGADDDPWPFSILDFYPDGLYPKPPLEDSLPLQTFLDFAYFFVMMRIRATSRHIHLVGAGISQKLKKALEDGWDQEIVELEEKFPEIAKLIHTIQFPEITADFWNVIQAVERKWEESTGVNSLIYGGTPDKMMRSSAEAQIRQSNSQIRPDDLRDGVTAWQSTVARKELIAQRLVLRNDVGVFFGEGVASGGQPMGPLTEAWMQTMATDDPWTAAQELAVTVEASTGRRKDKAKQIADLQESGQVVLPLLMQAYQATGDPAQVNAFLTDWASALDLDPNRYLMPNLQQQMMAMQQQAAQQGAMQQPEQQVAQESPPEQPPEEEMGYAPV